MSMNDESSGVQKEVVVTYLKALLMPVLTKENYAKP
jgi:hypothetical protein